MKARYTRGVILSLGGEHTFVLTKNGVEEVGQGESQNINRQGKEYMENIGRERQRAGIRKKKADNTSRSRLKKSGQPDKPD